MEYSLSHCLCIVDHSIIYLRCGGPLFSRLAFFFLQGMGGAHPKMTVGVHPINLSGKEFRGLYISLTSHWYLCTGNTKTNSLCNSEPGYGIMVKID